MFFAVLATICILLTLLCLALNAEAFFKKGCKEEAWINLGLLVADLMLIAALVGKALL